MATMVTSTKKVPTRGVGSGGFPGPNGKKPGGNGWKGGDGSPRKFSSATYRITMWVVLAAIVMMFAALSSIYIMSSEEQWRPVAMPRMFFVSTGLILISSGTFQRAKRSLQRQETRAHLRWLLVTLALGMAFLISQFIGWRELARAVFRNRVLQSSTALRRDRRWRKKFSQAVDRARPLQVSPTYRCAPMMPPAPRCRRRPHHLVRCAQIRFRRKDRSWAASRRRRMRPSDSR